MMPTPTHDIEFLYREVIADPISWADPLSWGEAIDAWMSLAAGDPELRGRTHRLGAAP
jgi:hypothetical protein